MSEYVKEVGRACGMNLIVRQRYKTVSSNTENGWKIKCEGNKVIDQMS
jgi:hypothetical protein